MILRPAICSGTFWLVGALLFSGTMMYDTVTERTDVLAVDVGELPVRAESQAWTVPTTLTARAVMTRAFVRTWAHEAFDLSAGCEMNHRKATEGISPVMRQGFADMFWRKPGCGHVVKFFVTSVDPIDMGATNGAWFEVHGMFQHGSMEMMPVTIAVLVGGTSQGGMQIEGYSELTDPLEKLMVAGCNDEQDCDENHAAVGGELSGPTQER